MSPRLGTGLRTKCADSEPHTPTRAQLVVPCVRDCSIVLLKVARYFVGSVSPVGRSLASVRRPHPRKLEDFSQRRQFSMSTRRNFLKMATMAGSSALLMRGLAWPFAQSPIQIRKFIVPLQGLGPTGIPVATPNPTLFPGEDCYAIRVGEFSQLMHPDLPGPTKFWGYADVTNGQAPNHRYLGGVIVAKKNRPVRLKAINQLPAVHPLPVDTTIMGSELDPNRICVHLHGGLVDWTSDGGPHAWFSPTGSGPSFLNGTGVPGEALYRYPNHQSARLFWYHDHAIGITRLNAYAGIASAYIIRDDVED